MTLNQLEIVCRLFNWVLISSCLKKQKINCPESPKEYPLDYTSYILSHPFLKHHYETIEKPKKGNFWYYQSIVTRNRECMVLSHLLVGQIESSKTSSSDPDSSSSLSKLDSSSLDSSLSSSSSKERGKHC